MKFRRRVDTHTHLVVLQPRRTFQANVQGCCLGTGVPHAGLELPRSRTHGAAVSHCGQRSLACTPLRATAPHGYSSLARPNRAEPQPARFSGLTLGRERGDPAFWISQAPPSGSRRTCWACGRSRRASHGSRWPRSSPRPSRRWRLGCFKQKSW